MKELLVWLSHTFCMVSLYWMGFDIRVLTYAENFPTLVVDDGCENWFVPHFLEDSLTADGRITSQTSQRTRLIESIESWFL